MENYIIYVYLCLHVYVMESECMFYEVLQTVDSPLDPYHL